MKPEQITLTERAILRFQERVRPGLSFRQARQQLTRTDRNANRGRSNPNCHHTRGSHRPGDDDWRDAGWWG